MNKLFLIGNLTRAPESRTTDTGLKVCSFTLAVNRRSQSDHPEADFFRVTAWRGLAEICQKYLDKGKKCSVIGRVEARAYIAKDGTPKASMEVTAEDIELLSPRGQDAQPPMDNSGYVQVDEEELPFP